MTCSASAKCHVLTLAVLSLTALAVPPLQGQSAPPPLTRTQFGIGYVGNAPDALVGGNVYLLLPELGPITGGIGLYVDFKVDPDNPTNERGYNSDLTVAELLADPNRDADVVDEDGSSFMSVNAALLRPVTPYLMAYAGGGVAVRTIYETYNVSQDDPAGVGGVVVVENPDREATRVNFMVGIMMRMSPLLSSQFGFETQPKGVTFGLSLRLPRW